MKRVTGCLALLVLSGGALAIASRSTLSMCESSEQRRVPSPDGRLDLVVFERNCGATTDFSTQVSVVPHGVALGDWPGNLYIYGHQVPLVVTWQSPAALTVHYPPGFRGLTETRRVHGVSADFAEDPTVKDP